MGILERVSQMKREGVSEKEIITKLQSEGTTPKEITDALTQAQIKNAISETPGNEEMQPSIMNQGAPVPEPIPTQQTQNNYTPQMPFETQQIPQGYDPQQDYYSEDPQPSEEYYPDDNYGGDSGTSSDLTIEIAEQVFSEKIKKFQKQIKGLEDFKAIYGTKIDDLSDRLKRMENLFVKMQISILNKIGSYSKGIENIQNEMEMIEDSVSKMIKPILDKTHKKK